MVFRPNLFLEEPSNGNLGEDSNVFVDQGLFYLSLQNRGKSLLNLAKECAVGSAN